MPNPRNETITTNIKKNDAGFTERQSGFSQ